MRSDERTRNPHGPGWAMRQQYHSPDYMSAWDQLARVRC
ncbi:DUF4113 domain-containing protein [Pseudomonas profundi]